MTLSKPPWLVPSSDASEPAKAAVRNHDCSKGGVNMLVPDHETRRILARERQAELLSAARAVSGPSRTATLRRVLGLVARVSDDRAAKPAPRPL